MPKDKSILKGKVTATVFELSEEGKRKFEELKNVYGENRRRNAEYVSKRESIFKEFGSVKRRNPGFFRRMLKLQGALMISVNHNIVTDQGDALIADLMATTPARTKVDNTNGYITVGTGWTGTTPKQNEAVNTSTGSPEVMDATYPKLKGTFGNTDDNVVQYRATFEAGDLNQTGIDEAGLGNNAVEASGDNLAYAQITPSVDVSSSDTLQVDWEITLLGA